MRKKNLRYLIVAVLTVLPAILFAQSGIKLDHRAYNHYTIDEINKMSEAKKRQVNFLFNQSFIVPEKYKEVVNPDLIDVLDYNSLRRPNDRVEVYLRSKEGEEEVSTDRTIILLSINELLNMYKAISENNGFIDSEAQGMYLNSGNSQAEIDKYKAQKKDWIEKHPDEYKAMNSSESNRTPEEIEKIKTEKSGEVKR